MLEHGTENTVHGTKSTVDHVNDSEVTMLTYANAIVTHTDTIMGGYLYVTNERVGHMTRGILRISNS